VLTSKSSQYHSALILLHRGCINPDPLPSSEKSTANGELYDFSGISRNICIENAITVASILKQYRQRYDLAKVFTTGLQHAGTAATALMAGMISLSDEMKAKKMLEPLLCLGHSISLMARTYRSAVAMSSIINRFVQQMREEVGNDRSSSSVPEHSNSCAQDRAAGGSAAAIGPADQYTGRLDSMYDFDGLPVLPASWFEGMHEWEDEDTAFLDLVGLSELRKTSRLPLPPTHPRTPLLH